MKAFAFRTGASLLASLAAVSLSATGTVAQVSVLTHQYNNYRTGTNLAEKELTVGNVNVSSFGRLFARPVDGEIYAQPLYVSALDMPGYGRCNVVFVVTMHNGVYAFDADDPIRSQPIWYRNLGPSVPVGDVQWISDISTEVGILSTPVIDRATGTLYLVARTKENDRYIQRLYALDVRTGRNRPGSPVVIEGSAPGSGDDSDGQRVYFNPMRNNQRPALLLSRGALYIAWSSHNDIRPYHGWVMSYDARTLQQKAAWCATPSGAMAGIWMSGAGPSADEDGNIYIETGNGTFTANVGGADFGNSIVKLTPDLTVADWFTPFNQDVLNAWDIDLGSSGVLVVPGTPYVLGASKEGVFYLLDRNKMGNFNSGSDSQITQRLQAGVAHIHGTPILWKSATQGNLVYVWSEEDHLKAYRFANNRFETTPQAISVPRVPGGMPGGFLTISSDRDKDGTGVLWASHPKDGNANNATVSGIVRAFDASNVGNELWNTEQDFGRDTVPTFAKNVPPTVANGRVYVATFSNHLLVYGLFNGLKPYGVNVAGGQTGIFRAENGSFKGGIPINAPSVAEISTAGVPRPAPAAVYRTARVGNTDFIARNLRPNSRYTLRFHLAELRNLRGRMPLMMNIRVNGQLRLQDFDVRRAAGGVYRAVVVPMSVFSDDTGMIRVEIRNGGKSTPQVPNSVTKNATLNPFLITQGAIINGIEIVPGTDIPGTAYSFDDVSGDYAPLNGVRGGIDFGTGRWYSDGITSFAGMTKYAYFASNTDRNQFRLPAGTHLKALRLGSNKAGTYSISDGVNPPRTGSFTPHIPVLVETGWTRGGTLITITMSVNWESGIDDITYSP